MQELQLITLDCPSCGGALQITPDINRFACAHCGKQHEVSRRGGTISVEPIVRGLEHVHEGVDRTASELAIKRVQEELDVLGSERIHINAKLLDKSKKRNDPLFVGIGLISLAIFGSFYWWDVGADIQYMIFCVGPTLLLGVGILINYRTRKRKIDPQEKRLIEVDEAIAAKKSELKHHKDMVSL